jgi:hypothetical protein
LFLSINCEYETIDYSTTTPNPATTTTTTTTTTGVSCQPDTPKNIAIECSNPGDTSSIVLASLSWDCPTYLCSLSGWSTVYVIEAMYNAELPGSDWVEIDLFFASLCSSAQLISIEI